MAFVYCGPGSASWALHWWDLWGGRGCFLEYWGGHVYLLENFIGEISVLGWLGLFLKDFIAENSVLGRPDVHICCDLYEGLPISLLGF